MKWVLENLGFVIVVTIAAVSFLRGAFRAAKGGGETPKRPVAVEDPDVAERTRRVQEEIRRKIAERRGAAREFAPQQTTETTVREIVPPLLRPTSVPPVDPFGGPMRRIAERLEDIAQRSMQPQEEYERREELERQQRLEAQMRALEAAKLAEQRRAEEMSAAMGRRTKPATAVIEFPAAPGLREQLRNKDELRRAVVLREILGAPVGLR